MFYDVSSSYYQGRTCPLALHGHPQVVLVPRDGKKGRPIIVYGALTDREGRPVAGEVYPGNTGDPSTVGYQVDKLRNRFGISRPGWPISLEVGDSNESPIRTPHG